MRQRTRCVGRTTTIVTQSWYVLNQECTLVIEFKFAVCPAEITSSRALAVASIKRRVYGKESSAVEDDLWHRIQREIIDRVLGSKSPQQGQSGRLDGKSSSSHMSYQEFFTKIA